MSWIRMGSAILSFFAILGPAEAHWCSNIFEAHARLVIKPEVTTLYVSGDKPAKLRVHLHNNFPYKMWQMEMRGSAAGYKIETSPAAQDVHPAQTVTYTFTISRDAGAGTVKVTDLNLQVRIRVGFWMGDSVSMVDPNPSQASLASSLTYTKPTQGASLNAATLADLYPNAKITDKFNRTGVEQLIHLFAHPFCYNSLGFYRCGKQDCPSPCAEGKSWKTSVSQFAHNCMRAGLELGVRKARLGSRLDAARAASITAMTGAHSPDYKCMGAMVGAVLWKGAASTAAYEKALDKVSPKCKAAGLRALGKGTPGTCSTSTAGTYDEMTACAGAEGLRGQDDPVKKILMVNAGDGYKVDSYSTQFYAYMLYLVTSSRRASGQKTSYYPEVQQTPDAGNTPDSSHQADAEADAAAQAGSEEGGGCAFTPGAPSARSAIPVLSLLLLGVWSRRRAGGAG